MRTSASCSRRQSARRWRRPRRSPARGTGPLRTLVISDLHLGARTERDVLRHPEAREPLLRALGEVDRLVLLGDVLELRHGPVRDALTVAQPVIASIGEALGAGKEVIIVPGNHDHHLAEPWLERRARKGVPPPLGLESEVDHRAGETLATLARWLGPAQVRAAYPGLWLRGDVYATHGHYIDRHTTVPMFERLGAGAMARIVREPAGGPASTEDYEATLAPVYAWIHAVAQSGGPELGASSHGASARAWRTLAGSSGGSSFRRRALIASFPALVAAINLVRIGPVRADVSGPELRRASLKAMAEVVGRLRIGAEHVVFGHTHRAGPLPLDRGGEWRSAGGGRLVNSGSWVHEPDFLGDRPAESPYRPGFAVRVEGENAPAMVNLLDGGWPPQPPG